jgi:hypothetical protein
MKIRLSISLCAMLLFIAVLQSRADDEAGNVFYVVANGGWYAKSIPAERYGMRGKTLLYLASPESDRLEYSYDWYSPGRLFLMQWAWGVSVVRFGPWHRGSSPSKDDFEIAFYNGKELLAKYSALDIAGSPDNRDRSVSHYTVIKKVLGYHWIGSNDYVFEIERVDGKILTFDIRTGKTINFDLKAPAK